MLDQFLRIEVRPAHLGAHASTCKGTSVSENTTNIGGIIWEDINDIST